MSTGVFHKKIIALSMMPGMGSAKIISSIDKHPKLDLDSPVLLEEIEYLDAHGINALSFWDNGYPSSLKEIYSPPVILYVKGRLIERDSNAVAIVGSRRCSSYGYNMAEKLAFDLAENGVTVISGLARGIDEAAHRGAIRAGGRTIAVMGSGFRNLYPYGCEDLAGLIAENGAVITENISSIKPLKYNFPKRNRIISGLSQGVVVVEASRKSGALITVDHALEQGKDVFAVPGRIDSSQSRGTNSLIKSGAKLVTDVEDILEELQGVKLKVSGDRFCGGEISDNGDLSGFQLKILEMLKDKKVAHIDEIIENAGDMDMGELSSGILEMELKARIKALPGKNYEIVS